MSGCQRGVATLVSEVEERAIYIHCCGHRLNLAVGDTIKGTKKKPGSKILIDALDNSNEIIKLIKMSPRRDNIFQKIKTEIGDNSTPNIRKLCPTRWTVRANSMRSIIENYETLTDVWQEALSDADGDVKARLNGVASIMEKFDYFFGLSLGEMLLRHSDNLSKALQKKDLSASEGLSLAQDTLITLKSLRNDERFDNLWAKVNLDASRLNIDEAKLPRKRKKPARYDDGSNDENQSLTAKDHYKNLYFEALDLLIKSITDRFQGPGFESYRNLEDLLLKCANGEPYQDEFDHVTKFYKDDLDPYMLETQLMTFGATFPKHEKITIQDIKQFMLLPGKRELMKQISVILKLILVIPATNASSERSFSALKRLKTYLRTTMSQERLNNLMLIHTHKEITDSLSMVKVCNRFVSEKESRLRIFGKFE